MKNKSKLKKIKAKNTQANAPKDWFYFNPKECTVVDIKNVLPEEKEVEIWEEAGVLEVSIGEDATMDFEQGEVDLRDEYSNAFLEKEKIQSLFYVSIRPEHAKEAQETMKLIISKAGGFFCADTEDFTPIIRG